MTLETALTRHAGIEVPLICGAMYPCSNVELVAAASEAGAIGIVQPVTLTFVHGIAFRDGLRRIRALTKKPIGMNALIERSSAHYLERMRRWVDEALDEGVRFFVTSLGDPRWVAEKAHAAGGVVYHDVTEAKWARKALDGGVDGLIAVNALRMGHAGVQCGTRFIATRECDASEAYKAAIVSTDENGIVLTERLTGVPLAVIDTPVIRRMGLHANALERWLLRNPRTKHAMRSFFAVKTAWTLRRGARVDRSQLWQAGKSVSGIHSVEPAGAIVRRWASALAAASGAD